VPPYKPSGLLPSQTRSSNAGRVHIVVYERVPSNAITTRHLAVCCARQDGNGEDGRHTSWGGGVKEGVGSGDFKEAWQCTPPLASWD
jgi:hypothetical protein